MEKLSTALWDELLELPLTDASSELSGFLSVLPTKMKDGVALVDTRRLSVARRMLKLYRFLGGQLDGKIAPGEGFIELDKTRGRAIFRLPEEIYSLHSRTIRKWAWFRGAWGGCGTLYRPHNGYYMSLRTPESSDAGNAIRFVLTSSGISPQTRVNKSRREYMIRDIEGIVTIMSAMGLVKTSLLLEETAVIRSVRGIANKIVNCDSANIASTIAAARTQMALVDAIDKNGLWNDIPPLLAEIAHKRRENPSASLQELGQSLSRPVSKSTVEYRWRKLETLIGEEK